MNLRIAQPHWQMVRELTAASFRAGRRFRPETGCILLIASNDHRARRSLLVADVLAAGEGDLADQNEGGITFTSRFLRRALLAARARGLAGLLTVHTHPFAESRVCFSGYDDANDPELMGNLSDLERDGVFGSVVLGKDCACARLWRDGCPTYLEELVCVGEALWFCDLKGTGTVAVPAPSAIFDRSAAVSGAGAMYRLSKFRVGVIGARGTGSLMIELLARAGVGEIVIFEFDVAEDTNLNRVLHLRERDVRAKTGKGQRMAEAIRELGLPTRVTVVEGGDIRDAAVAGELHGCDLLLGCVDRHWPRLILSEVAYRYLIPYVDLGTEIGVEGQLLQSLDARVSYVAPMRPCLRCTNVVTDEGIRLEGLSEEERIRIINMGYSKDVKLRAPSVMDLNMRAASAAMLWIRHLLQPFLAGPLPDALKETVTNFSIKQLIYTRGSDCKICRANTWGSGGRFGLTVRSSVEMNSSEAAD